jgi:ribosomal protein S7
MLSRKIKTSLPKSHYRLYKLIQVLLRQGNRARCYRLIKSLFIVLKKQLSIKQGTKTMKPLSLVDKALFIAAPVFTYRRTFVAGKLYEIPVSINPNRANFMASQWIRLTILRKTKVERTISLLPSEVIALLKKTGDVIARLNEYTADGLDKNIFKKYLRVKRKVISRSKNSTGYKAILTRLNKL